MKRPVIYLKIINKKDKEVRMVKSGKKMKVYSILQAEKFKDCVFFLKVVYSYRPYYVNQGEYFTKKSLIYALRAFTDLDLVKEFCEK